MLGEAVAPDDKTSLAQVARYMLRASVVMARISYDRDHAAVRIDPHGPHTEGPIEPRLKDNYEIMKLKGGAEKGSAAAFQQ